MHELRSGARSWARIHGVDILRGLAIFFVLMNHVNMRLFLAKIPYTQGLPAQLASSLVWNGQYGVQIFFAVSGFLITSTSIRRWGSLNRISLIDFYALRFARIAPLLFLLLAVLCTLHSAGLKNFVVSEKTGGLGRALTAALTFQINLLEARRGYLPANWDVLWSLSVEEAFYLLYPLVCYLLGRGIWLIALLLFFIVLGPIARTVLAHGNEVWREYSYLGGMDAIAFGCLTAIAIARVQLRHSASWVMGSVGSVLLLLILCASNRIKAWGIDRSGLDMTFLAIGTCLLIAAAAQSRWKAPRVTYPLRILGQFSYEIYLTHMFVIFAFFGLFKAAGGAIGLVPILFITVILTSTVMGQLVSRFYSEPMNRLLRTRFGEGAGRLGSVIQSDSAARERLA